MTEAGSTRASSAARSREGEDSSQGAHVRTSAHADLDDEFAPPNSKEEALAFDSEHLLRTENIPFDVGAHHHVVSC